MYNKLPAKTAKITPLENLYVYGTFLRYTFQYLNYLLNVNVRMNLLHITTDVLIYLNDIIRCFTQMYHYHGLFHQIKYKFFACTVCNFHKLLKYNT